MARLDGDSARGERAKSSTAIARLQEVAREVAAGGDVCRHILDAAVEILASDAGSIQVVDDKRRGLRLAAWRGFHPKSAAFWAFVEAGSSATCGTALGKGERVIVEDVEAVAAFAGSDDLCEWRRSGIRAVQSTLLVTRDGRVVGMLSTHWRAPHEPIDEELRLLDVLARQAADLLDREQARTELESTRALLDDALAAARMATWVWDPESERTDASASLGDVLGLLRGETLVSSSHRLELVHPEDRERHCAILERAGAVGGSWHHEFRIIRPRDGRTAWLEERLTSTRDSVSGKVRVSGLVWDVTEAKQVEADRNRREQREREFVANAAHELRTPLTAIVTSVEALARGAGDAPETRARFFAHVQREAARLARLCDSLLLLAQVDASRNLPTMLVPLRRLLEELSAELEPEAAVAMTVDAPNDLCVETNGVLLERVVWNLAENAIKNTERGRVGLCAYASDGAVVIEVRDTGVGLSADTEARAFDRFYRDRACGRDGFGLGLSIAHQAAQVLGGHLSLERRRGGGTTARLSLPSRRLRLRQGAVEPSRSAQTRAPDAAYETRDGAPRDVTADGLFDAVIATLPPREDRKSDLPRLRRGP